jgi:predicted nucleic acid-binding protein
MVIVDTNIIIDHLRLQQKQASYLMRLVENNPKETIALSVISVQELYEGMSTRVEEKEQYLLATISPLQILPYSYEVAQLAGEIARDIDRPIELADAAIAATAIMNGAQLYTLNTKDFAGIKRLDLYKLN